MATGAKEGEEMLLLEGLRLRRETRRGFELRVLINKKPLALTNRDIDGTEKGELRQWTSAGTSADVIFTQPSLSLSPTSASFSLFPSLFWKILLAHS